MTLDLAKLKEAAEKASRGPWRLCHEDGTIGSIIVVRDAGGERVCCDEPYYPTAVSEEDAAHIALANPATILALIERLESAEEIVRAFTGDPHIGHIAAARAHMEKHNAKP